MEEQESVFRFDAGELEKPVKLDNGWLRVSGFITRTGVFSYMKADGSLRRELRLPEEVFNPEVINSFALTPVTDGHPSVGRLDSTNTAAYSKGSCETPVQDGKMVRARMLITDAGLVAKLEKKLKTQISCGYSCQLEMTAGEYEGERYDAIQRNIRGNHIAIVSQGRAGPEARIRLDSSDAVMVDSEAITVPITEKILTPEVKVEKINLDGIDFEVAEPVAQAVTKVLAAKEETVKAVQADLEKATARADGLSEELKKVQISLTEATDPSKVSALVNARVELVSKASKVIGSDFKSDSLTDREIKLAVLAKTSPEFKADGKSDDYVSARFDVAVEAVASRTSALSTLATAPAPTAPGNLEADARAKMIEYNKSLFGKKA